MHELAVTQSIVDQVQERMEGRPVTCVQLEVGKMSGVVADSIRFCFDLVTAGTPLEGSALLITEPEGRGLCATCGRDFVLSDLILLCPCGSADVTIVSGTELLIKSVRVG